jgi:hypothetical protein
VDAVTQAVEAVTNNARNAAKEEKRNQYICLFIDGTEPCSLSVVEVHREILDEIWRR